MMCTVHACIKTKPKTKNQNHRTKAGASASGKLPAVERA
jgi:hypothetical protein